MLYGKQTIEGQIYFFNEITGKQIFGEQNIDGEWHHFDEETGVMTTGWFVFPDKKVFYKPDGKMVHGEYNIDSKWYHFNTYDGRMETGWVQLREKKVYYNLDGTMYYGKLISEGKEYYLQPITGAMTIGLFSFDGKEVVGFGLDGAKVYGEYCFGGKWYYFDEKTGIMHCGWKQLPEKLVYYLKSGEMAYGRQEIDGSVYYFDVVTGAQVRDNWQKIGDLWYYFLSDGTLDIIRKPQRDFIGTCRARIVKELSEHEYDWYYIGTPYRGLNVYAPNYEEIMYPNGAPRWDGYRGLNCTGFIAYVMRKCGADLGYITNQGRRGGFCNASNWWQYAKSHMPCYGYSSVSALLASGKAEKGDLIYCEPNWNWPGADCHLGFFWGNNAYENRFWHMPYPRNVISNIYSGTAVETYYLIKTSD